MKISILGYGVMGRGMAKLAIQNGAELTLYTRDVNRTLEDSWIQQMLESAEPTKSILSLTSDLNDLSDSDMIIEAISESFEMKISLFREILELKKCSEAILATSTSSLPPKEMSACLDNPSNFMAIHFFNPPTKSRLVEISFMPQNPLNTRNRALEVIKQLGKIAIEVPSHPGFLVNRLLFSYLLEALLIINSGESSMENVDQAMKLGCAHPMGPFELMDFIGLDTCSEIISNLILDSPAKTIGLAELEVRIAEKKLGRKTGVGFYSY